MNILEPLEKEPVVALYKGQCIEMTREEAEAMADYARSWANACLPIVTNPDDKNRVERIKALALSLADMVEC